MAVWKIALAPYAVVAKCWSDANVMFSRVTHGAGLREVIGLPGSPASMFAENAMKASEAVIEYWKAVRAVYNLKRR